MVWKVSGFLEGIRCLGVVLIGRKSKKAG
jgi:hypothetical protein